MMNILKPDPHKQFYTEGARSFIRYEKKPRLIIEIFKFEVQTDANKFVIESKNGTNAEGIAYLDSIIYLNNSWYLLQVIDLPDGPIEIEDYDTIKKVTRILDRLANWYRYTILNQ